MKPDANHDDESPSTGASESAPDYPLRPMSGQLNLPILHVKDDADM